MFDHIDEACVQCKRRGWSCTANDKTGPPSQQHNSNAVESPAALLQSTFALSPAPSVSERFELRDQTPRWRAITPPCDESSIADDLSKVPSEKELVVNVSGSDLFPPPTISTRQYQPLSNDTTHRIEVTTTSSSVVAKNIVEPSIVANYNPCTVSADAPQNSSATVTSGARLVHSPSATVCPSRALSLPNEFVFINHNVDGLYQRYYDDVLRNSLPTANESWLPLYFLGRRVNVQKKFIFFEFPQLQSSPLVKSAQLAFGSFAKNKEFGPHTYRYINCFVRRAITAIENGDLLNLVYASYIIALLYLFAGNSPDSDPAAIQSHILQFARSVSAFLYQRRGIVDERLATVERMWNRIIRIFSILRGSINDAATGLNLEEDHHSVLEQSQCLVPQDIWIWALSHSNEQQIFVKLSTLTSILAAQLSSFVFQVKINPSPNPPEKAISELRHKVDITMEQIRTLITMLPEAFDLVREAAFFGLSKSKKGDLTIEDFNGIGGGASCKSSSRTDRSHVSRLDAGVFCLVSLARAGLINPMDGLKDGSSDIVCWALALCYLCGSEPFCGVRALRIMYELMWAGIILTRQRFPAGETIRS